MKSEVQSSITLDFGLLFVFIMTLWFNKVMVLLSVILIITLLFRFFYLNNKILGITHPRESSKAFFIGEFYHFSL